MVQRSQSEFVFAIYFSELSLRAAKASCLGRVTALKNMENAFTSCRRDGMQFFWHQIAVVMKNKVKYRSAAPDAFYQIWKS